MMVIKDAMILIHLAKLSLLETCCDYFGGVFIPNKVKEEAVDMGKEKGYPDAVLIQEVIDRDKLSVQDVDDKGLIERVNKFNIQGGEAEAVALYWEIEADLLATDDDNVRSKKTLLDLKIVGTLPILLRLFKAGDVDEKKFKDSLDMLKEIGWFSSAVLDKTAMEAGIV